MLETFTQSTFSGHVGESFRIHAGPQGPLQAELTDVSPRAEAKPRPFSIVFRVPLGDPHLPQGTYRIEHDQMAAFELFLVPIGPDSERKHMLYEAVFN